MLRNCVCLFPFLFFAFQFDYFLSFIISVDEAKIVFISVNTFLKFLTFLFDSFSYFLLFSCNYQCDFSMIATSSVEVKMTAREGDETLTMIEIDCL